jgi:hypothetical protein
MRVGQEGLAALGRPLDGAVELWPPRWRHVLGVQEDLGAEAAAHVGRDHAHLVLGQAQHEGRHQQPLDVRVLVGHVQRVLVRGAVVAGVGGARLHRVGDQAVVDQVQLGDVRGAGEGGVHRGLVAQRPLVAVVVGRLVVQRRALGGGAHVDHRRQLLVVHLHQPRRRSRPAAASRPPPWPRGRPRSAPCRSPGWGAAAPSWACRRCW